MQKGGAGLVSIRGGKATLPWKERQIQLATEAVVEVLCMCLEGTNAPVILREI